MSRIGKMPINIPTGVDVLIEGSTLTIKGPLGSLTRELPPEITVERLDNSLLVKRSSDDKKAKALHGLLRTLISNMVEGVSKGFVKELEIVGVGYRATQQSPSKLELALGFSHPVVVDAKETVSFEVPAPTRILVKGIDKELVGQTAANIRRLRPPEPYKGKGIKYVNERIIRKAGKAAK
jgi:large subunit ribosomal protein L6